MSGKKWSKKKENYNNKQYFDPQRITTILDKTHAKDYDIGLSLTEKYICDYPNDPIGYLSKARLLILTGNIEEGESLADSTFFMGSYHDDSARVNGAMIYGSILQILGKYDEALNIYQEAITNYRITDNPEKYLAFLDEYIEFLHRQNKNDEIIEFVRLNPRINENSKYVVKVGQAYYKKRDYSTAINILKKVKCDDRVESQRCFYLGISYYQQYLIHKNESDLLEAKKILLQSLSQKSPRYYISCYTLAQIYRLMDNELKALEYIKYAISSYNLMMADSSARIADFYTIECQIYLDVCDYDKFFESLNMIEDEYSKKRLLMRYYCNTRQYEECIKTCEYLLGVDISDKAEDKQDDNVRVALYHLLCSFISLLIDNIYHVNPQLGEEEDAVAVAEEGAAVGAVVFLEPGVADGDAGLGLDAPVAGQDPRIAVLGAEGHEVALQAVVLDGGVEAEGDAGVAHVEVAIDEVGLQIGDAARAVEGYAPERVLGDEAAVLMATEIAAHVRRDEEVAPFLVLLLVDVPGVQADVGTDSPGRVEPNLRAEVRSQRGGIRQVGAQCHRLSTCLTEKHNHQKSD